MMVRKGFKQIVKVLGWVKHCILCYLISRSSRMMNCSPRLLSLATWTLRTPAPPFPLFLSMIWT